MRLQQWDNRKTLPENWVDQIVWLWMEDDARPPDREMAPGAFNRIFGRRYKHETKITVADDGDYSFALYASGRVLGHTCEGGLVGVLVVVEE